MDLTINQSKVTKKEDFLESLKDEKQYYKNLEKEKKVLEKDIRQTKTHILNKSRQNALIVKEKETENVC